VLHVDICVRCMLGNELICCPHSIVHIYLSISYKFKFDKIIYESVLNTRKQPLPVYYVDLLVLLRIPRHVRLFYTCYVQGLSY
jgi:hypothetical protein